MRPLNDSLDVTYKESLERDLLGKACLDVARLRRALGYFIDDPRFQINVGGDPRSVTHMLARARKIYDETGISEDERTEK